MVTQVLSLSRSGLTDFVIQRVTAVILALYALCVIGFFVTVEVDHAALTAWFLSMPMQVFSTLALLSTIAHAWIGMWTIGTDYLRTAQIGALANSLRFLYQLGCLLLLFVYLVWGLRVIWQF